MSSYIKKFNPYDLPEATLKAIATGRERVLEDILAIIAGNAAGGRVQHLQVVAPRGYGKSFLMRMAQSALKARIAEGLPAVLALLPEEQHNVDAPHRLLNEIQRLLEGRPAGSLLGGAFDETEGAWEEAVAGLDKAIAARLPEGRGIAVAIVENFDQLIKDIFRKPRDQSRLRALLDRPGGRLMLLATATRRADAAYEQRLFHATRMIELEPWREEACITFFEKLRDHRRAGPMSPQLQAKAKALSQFIGGSPRMATVLAEVLENNDSLRVAQMLDALVDELTPYYKHRIESLSRRARTLLDALLRMGEPRTQSEIAARLGVVQSRIAEPFNELRAGGEVVGVKAQNSSEMLYRVSDRLMAHYYRKRHLGVGDGTALLEGIVEFLESFYTPEEKQAEAERLRALGYMADAAVFEGLVMKSLIDSGQSGAESTGDWLEEMRGRLIALNHTGQFDEALVLCRQTVKRAEASGDGRNHARSLRFLGYALSQKRLYGEAEETLRRGLALAEQIGDRSEREVLLRALGWTFGHTSRYVEAEEVLRGALDLAEQIGDRRKQLRSLRILGWTLNLLKRYVEAEKELRRAFALAEKIGDRIEQAQVSRMLGWTLGDTGRYEEAEKELRRAVALAEQIGDYREQAQSFRLLGWTLNLLGQHAEAEEKLHRALTLAEQLGDAFSITWAEYELLRVASDVGGDASVFAAWQRVNAAMAEVPDMHRLPPVDLWIDTVAAAALRSGRFGTLWSIWGESAQGRGLDRAQQGLVQAVVEASKSHGRAEAYALALNGIEVLARVASAQSTRDDRAGSEPIVFLRGMLSILARQLTDPALLRDITALLEQRLPAETVAERALLEAAARRAEDPSNPAALERVDPDVATALETTIGSSPTPAKRTRPGTAKRSGRTRRKN